MSVGESQRPFSILNAALIVLSSSFEAPKILEGKDDPDEEMKEGEIKHN